MYKNASDSRQAALHHGRLADWVNGDEGVLSVEDRRRNLIAGLGSLEEQIKQSSGEERRKLGLQKLEWQGELSRLKKEHAASHMDGRDLTQCFRDVAKEMLPKVQYERIMNAARREMQENAKRAEKLRAELSADPAKT